MSEAHQLEIFRRQVLQRVPLLWIRWPIDAILGDLDTQQYIHESIVVPLLRSDIDDDGHTSRWVQQFGKSLSAHVTGAAEVSEDGDVFDTLVEDCIGHQELPVLSDAEEASRDVNIIYSAGPLDHIHDQYHITLQEKPRTVAGAGFTGHRTWEAALALAQEIQRIWLPEGRLKGKRVLELGGGTGLLSFVCAAAPNGASRVVATDGDMNAIARLSKQRDVNVASMPHLSSSLQCGIYGWGEPFDDTIIADEAQHGPFDLVLGADVVSGDVIEACVV